jgi:hypothetical protein
MWIFVHSVDITAVLLATWVTVREGTAAMQQTVGWLLNTALEDFISVKILFAFTQQVTQVIACRRFERKYGCP